jgi:lipopolysaccharide transport system ATP-binding protein
MREFVLQANNLSKRFKIYSNPWSRALEWATLGRKKNHGDFWALKNVSFQMKHGEFLGIIGMNGAGKSTLLKIISGILEPTQGSYAIDGRSLSLLELSGQFDPDLSGRENVFRSALMLNFPESYCIEQLGNIIEFSELGDFFDQPVKSYSSGMRLRLSFSLFAFLRSDILIMDEAIAVGDIFFRQKCHQRMAKMVEDNTSIILVSHALEDIRHYCERVIVLNEGQIVYEGTPYEAIRIYNQIRRLSMKTTVRSILTPSLEGKLNIDSQNTNWDTSDQVDWPDESELLPPPDGKKRNKAAQLVSVAICGEDKKATNTVSTREWLNFFYEVECDSPIDVLVGRLEVLDKRGILIHGRDTVTLESQHPKHLKCGDRVRFHQRMQLSLKPGEYTVSLKVYQIPADVYQARSEVSSTNLLSSRDILVDISPLGMIVVLPEKDPGLEGFFEGLCDLSGECETQVRRTAL